MDQVFTTPHLNVYLAITWTREAWVSDQQCLVCRANSLSSSNHTRLVLPYSHRRTAKQRHYTELNKSGSHTWTSTATTSSQGDVLQSIAIAMQPSPSPIHFYKVNPHASSSIIGNDHACWRSCLKSLAVIYYWRSSTLMLLIHASKQLALTIIPYITCIYWLDTEDKNNSNPHSFNTGLPPAVQNRSRQTPVWSSLRSSMQLWAWETLKPVASRKGTTQSSASFFKKLPLLSSQVWWMAPSTIYTRWNLWVQCETLELGFLKCSIKWDVLTFCFSPVSASLLHSFYSLENATLSLAYSPPSFTSFLYFSL